MKKKILGLAIAMMSLTAVSGVAQTANDNTAATCPQEQVCNKTTGCTKDARKCPKGQCNLFEGLDLTDTQRAQLQQLNDKRRLSRDQAMQARKADRMRTDSTARAGRRAAKREYLEEVKAIIGPDQYVTFLENVYINGGAPDRRPGHKAAVSQGRDAKARAMRKGNGDRKLGRDGQRPARMVKASANLQSQTAGK